MHDARHIVGARPHRCLSQPTLQREGDAGLMGASSKKGKCTESPPTFIQGKRQKNQKGCGLRTLIGKGSGVIFTHGEGISTPRVRHNGQQPLIKCANMTSKCFILPFLCLCVFLCLLYFLYFCGRQGCFPRSYVSSTAMRKSDLRSSFRTKRWLSCFDLFLQDRFNRTKVV